MIFSSVEEVLMTGSLVYTLRCSFFKCTHKSVRLFDHYTFDYVGYLGKKHSLWKWIIQVKVPPNSPSSAALRLRQDITGSCNIFDQFKSLTLCSKSCSVQERTMFLKKDIDQWRYTSQVQTQTVFFCMLFRGNSEIRTSLWNLILNKSKI